MLSGPRELHSHHFIATHSITQWKWEGAFNLLVKKGSLPTKVGAELEVPSLSRSVCESPLPSSSNTMESVVTHTRGLPLTHS